MFLLKREKESDVLPKSQRQSPNPLSSYRSAARPDKKWDPRVQMCRPKYAALYEPLHPTTIKIQTTLEYSGIAFFIFLSAHTNTRVRINEYAEICRGAIRHVSHNDKYQSYGTRRIVTQTSVRFTRSPKDQRKGYNRKMPCSPDHKVLHWVMEDGALDRGAERVQEETATQTERKREVNALYVLRVKVSNFYQALIKGEYERFFCVRVMSPKCAGLSHIWTLFVGGSHSILIFVCVSKKKKEKSINHRSRRLELAIFQIPWSNFFVTIAEETSGLSHPYF